MKDGRHVSKRLLAGEPSWVNETNVPRQSTGSNESRPDMGDIRGSAKGMRALRG